MNQIPSVPSAKGSNLAPLIQGSRFRSQIHLSKSMTCGLSDLYLPFLSLMALLLSVPYQRRTLPWSLFRVRDLSISSTVQIRMSTSSIRYSTELLVTTVNLLATARDPRNDIFCSCLTDRCIPSIWRPVWLNHHIDGRRW